MSSPSNRRIVLVDPDAETRDVFAQRLRAQGFVVDEAADGVVGAEMALADPPAAVISDLWMPGVSGVQLCRLLGAEPATADVPVVLRSVNDDARSRFWARRAGARRLVMKGRMGELVRAIGDVTVRSPHDEDAFFFHLSGSGDVRDRIAQHLDRALFESVVAAEVRALASSSSFDRLFDSLSQLVVQLVEYRWLALTTPSHFGIHAHRTQAAAAEEEARKVVLASDAYSAMASGTTVRILDDDANDASSSERTIVYDILLGGTRLGQLAFGIPTTKSGPSDVDAIGPLVAKEFGAVIRLVLLLEESQRLATTDGLTGLFNRRAFVESVRTELTRSERTGSPVSLLLLDLDHFKAINDTHGHGAGDAVLAAVAKALKGESRAYDIVGRWGGEEFVITLPSTDESRAGLVAERVRETIEQLPVATGGGVLVPLSVSIGAAQHQSGETLEMLVDRADRAMYSAKVGGRNRVCLASEEASKSSPAKAASQASSASLLMPPRRGSIAA